MNLKTLLIAAIATASIISFTAVPPARADDAFVRASDPASVINVRSNPSTSANQVGESRVGDRVELLQRSTPGDGYAWYRVRIYRSGVTGWIRGDFLCFESNCAVTSNPNNPGSSNTAAQIASQIRNATLRDAEAILRRNGYQQDGNAQSSGQFVVKRYRNSQTGTTIRVNYSDGVVASATVENQTPSQPDNQTIYNFSTRTYAVRVYRQGSQVRMNVYNRQANQLPVNAQPARVSTTQAGTRYVYSGDLTYEVRTSGNRPVLTIRRGNTIILEEESL